MSEPAFPQEVFSKGIRQINLSGAVAKGFNCTVKAILKGKARVVFVANDADAKDYKTLITGLCKKNDVKVFTVPAKEDMGKALGLTHLKADGSVRRQMKCGACAITKYGKVENQEITEFRTAFEDNKQN